jgi:hypothetical protein
VYSLPTLSVFLYHKRELRKVIDKSSGKEDRSSSITSKPSRHEAMSLPWQIVIKLLVPGYLGKQLQLPTVSAYDACTKGTVENFRRPATRDVESCYFRLWE